MCFLHKWSGMTGLFKVVSVAEYDRCRVCPARKLWRNFPNMSRARLKRAPTRDEGQFEGGHLGAAATFLLVLASDLPTTTVKMHKKQNSEIQHATRLTTPGPGAKIV